MTATRNLPGHESLGPAAVQAARARIAPHATLTPVLTSRSLDGEFGASLFFKCENLQRTGAFKFRGACNAVMSMSEAELRRGVATHSSGNHAAALTLAASLRGAHATVVMPSNSAAPKRAAVLRYGGEVIECAPDQQSREQTLATVVGERGCEVVEPFDDARVIAGQGTATAELLEQVTGLDQILAPVGGGGLLAGTSLAAAAVCRPPRLVGVEPAAADDTFRSFISGERQTVKAPRTIADGLRTSVGRLTFPIIKERVDDVVCVEEKTIIAAMRMLWERMKVVVEPSGAVPLAALLEGRIVIANGARIGIILSGGNVDLDRLPWAQS